jgi:hypothetical protein
MFGSSEKTLSKLRWLCSNSEIGITKWQKQGDSN